MPVVGRRSRELVDNEFPEITWEHSHVVVDGDGYVTTYCIYEGAERRDRPRALASGSASTSMEGLHEIVGDVSPGDFPP